MFKRFSLWLLFFSINSTAVIAQIDLSKPFEDCHINGSITLYDYQNKKWIYSDEKDSQIKTLPASTFKIINTLIALETGVIKDENEIVKWVGKTDTTLYGYRPEIYKDMTVKEAFALSAGWVYLELAKRIGKKRYMDYLKKCQYGNVNLSEMTSKSVDFWNFGQFGISPKNQVEFLIKLYEEKLPFSKRSFEIVKRIMITETQPNYVIRAKTGWTRFDNKDTGWWVGYVESKGNVYFFATRLIKLRSEINQNFGSCRKEITKKVLKELQFIE